MLCLSAERVETCPQVGEYVLKQVLHLVVVLGKHIAHGVYGGLVPVHELRKFLFLVHGRVVSSVLLFYTLDVWGWCFITSPVNYFAYFYRQCPLHALSFLEFRY